MVIRVFIFLLLFLAGSNPSGAQTRGTAHTPVDTTDTPWVLDLDIAVGDQGVRELNAVRPEQEVTIELIARYEVNTTVGAEVVFKFDSTKVEPLTFKSVGRSGFMPYGPRLIQDNTFTFAFVSLKS